MASKFTDYERSLYKLLFDEFQKDNFHYEFCPADNPKNYVDLVSALEHLQEEEVLFIIGNDDSGICVELDPLYCFDFKEI